MLLHPKNVWDLQTTYRNSMQFFCFQTYTLWHTLGYHKWNYQSAPTGIQGFTTCWFDFSPLHLDLSKIPLFWKWPGFISHHVQNQTTHTHLQCLHFTPLLVFFLGCLQSPGTKDGVWSDCKKQSFLCYDTTLKDYLLLQQNVNRYSFFSPSYAKISATQENDNGNWIPPHPPLVIPQKKKQQPKVMPKPDNAYPRKTHVVNGEVCHLYSLQHLTVPDFIYVFYPVDFLTHPSHQYYTKLDWIWCTCHHIYISLNEAKRDPTHPVWSVVNEPFKHKCLCWSILQYYPWQHFLSKAFLPVKHLLTNKI